MPPYNSNNNIGGIPFSRSSSNPKTNNNISANNMSISASATIIPSRVSSFQKSVDEGRGCPQQVVTTETGSCGSSLTSQPQPTSSFGTTKSHSQSPQKQPNNNRYTGTGTTTTTSSHNNRYQQSSHSVVSESSVVFQKSVGLSKLLAPSSPTREQQQQDQEIKDRSSSLSPPLADNKKMTSATSSSPITSTRFASSIRRNRILQRSLNELNGTITTINNTVTSTSTTTSAIKSSSPTSSSKKTTTSVSPPQSPVSSTNTDHQRRNLNHQRLLRQTRRPSSIHKQQQHQPPSSSSLSPPRIHSTDTTNDKDNKSLGKQQQQRNISPTKKSTATATTTTVAAAMIAAAANRRLEKTNTNSPPSSPPATEQQQQQHIVEQQHPGQKHGSGTVTTRKASAYHQATLMRREQQKQQQSQESRLPSPTKAISPMRSRNGYQQQYASPTQQQKHESVVRRNPLSSPTQDRQHESAAVSSISNTPQSQQRYPSHYQDVVDTTSSLSPIDRYESIQPKQHYVVLNRQYNHNDGYTHQQPGQHHSPQMMVQRSYVGRGQHLPDNAMMSQYSPVEQHLPQQYTTTATSDDYPEMPSLLPDIQDTGPYPMDERRHLEQQQQMDIGYNGKHQGTSHLPMSGPRRAYNPDDAIQEQKQHNLMLANGMRYDDAGSPNKNASLHQQQDGTRNSMRAMQNSPGTTSPYSHYPVPRSSKKTNNGGNHRQKYSQSSGIHPNRQRKPVFDEEEKKFSEPLPIYQRQHSGGLQRTSSSSDYETDYSRGGGEVPYHHHRTKVAREGGSNSHHHHNRASSHKYRERALKNGPTFSNMSASQVTPDVAAFFENSSELKSRSARDDDTFDYGDRDDDIDDPLLDTGDDTDSQGSLSYEQRRKKMEEEREARAAAVAAAKAEMDGPFMKQDDVEHYRKVLDTPLGRTAAVVATAATVGCVLLGPMGLFLGVAAVGIGVGYMQIPEEQRQNMNSKVTDAVKSAQESAIDASEKLSINCLATYKESGMSEHVPVEMETCCVNLAGLDAAATQANGHDEDASLVQDNEDKAIDENGNAVNIKSVDKRKPNTPTHSNWRRGKTDKVTCLRKGKIVPVAQIHALDPSAQPRAWLDVLANADTSSSEKIEASEEVLILAKDKQKSRIFVDEGILDCLLWTIGRYHEKQQRGPGSEHWTNLEIKPDEKTLAKLAANCCLTLGKSYCAAIHTEGDLLLMSLYDRGTVPEERQLAQMLMEVPHHTRSTKTDDPTVVTPGKESFTLKQLTLSQAEELASVITSIAKA